MANARSALLRLLRVALLILLFLIVLPLVMAIFRPETGALEKIVLIAAVIGLLALAMPVHGIGQPRSRSEPSGS